MFTLNLSPFLALKNLALAYEIWFKKDKFVEEAKLLMNKLDYDDKDKVKDIIRIAQNCKDMAALI